MTPTDRDVDKLAKWLAELHEEWFQRRDMTSWAKYHARALLTRPPAVLAKAIEERKARK